MLKGVKMTSTKNNRRTQYTTQVIKEAYLQLLKENELTKIKVTEICKRADVNRGTFYNHFEDTSDLFREIENDLMKKLKPIVALQPHEQLQDWLKRFIIVLKENEPVSQIILADYQNSAVVKAIFSEVQGVAINEFKIIFQEDNPKLLEYYFTYFVKGTVGILVDWLENDTETSVDDIANILTKLISTICRKDFTTYQIGELANTNLLTENV